MKRLGASAVVFPGVWSWQKKLCAIAMRRLDKKSEQETQRGISPQRRIKFLRHCRVMSKRAAEEHENGGAALKSGGRPETGGLDTEVGEFEDEFEDEYESEDEILEAGVDGRPDAEREADERAGE
jgi:hypothetical protein